MRCVQIIETGWEKDLKLSALDSRNPSGNEIKVRVQACGVCYRDCIDRRGQFAFINTPIIPGHEAVGEVVALGPDVTRFKIGDRVGSMHRDYCDACEACQRGQTSLCSFSTSALGLLIDGGYAEEMVLPEKCFFLMPKSLSDADAAIMHCTFGTAYRGLNQAGTLAPNSRVLITGANGGVGHAGIQVAKRLGAYVIAIVRNDAHRAWLSELGADEVIVDETGKFHKQIGTPVNIVLDCVGEPTFNASLRSLGVGGTLVVIGNITPDRVNLNLGYVITRGISIVGSSGATPTDMEAVFALCKDEPFDTHIECEWPLEKADEAQRKIQAGGVKGRIVLKP